MADDKLLELIDVLNKQSKKVRVTDADEKELDPIIRRLDDSQIPDYQIAANIADAAKLVICINKKVDCADYSHKYAQKQNNKTTQDCYNPIIKSEVDGALQCSTQVVNNAEVIDTKIVSNSNKYLLKKIIEKAIVNIAKSKKYVMGIQIGEEHKDTIDKIKTNLKAAEDILKGKVEELNKQFTDERSQKEKITESATQVYNSYLLLYKLNELKVNNGRSLTDVISEATLQNKKTVSVTIHGEQDPYLVRIEKQSDSSYKLKLLSDHTKPEVKNVLDYNDEEIIDLWANSEVSIEKDQSNNFAFAVGLHDKSRLLDLKVGGLGKKVPFSLRFANFYKVIELLKDEKTPLEERFRLANNIATGSGKTGDIALLKLWAYLANIPCITMVPSDTLRNQSNKFDEEFLPGEVAMEFGEPFSEGNTRYATTTFTEVLDKQWNLFNNTYGKDNGESALIMIDEAPKLKENVVLLARSIEIARNNPVAFFSATPDAFLSEEFKIILQILLSPKERAALGIGKLPVVYYRYVPTPTLEESYHKKGKAVGYLPAEEAYIQKNENTHEKLNGYEDAVKKFKTAMESYGKHPDLSQLSQPFLDFINQSLDSQAYKEGLIATEERWARDVTGAIINNDNKTKRIDSFVEAIEGLKTGLKKDYIKRLVEQNLNVEVGGQLLPYIKLHNIIDTLNEYKKNGEAVEVSQFIKDKYGIIDSDNLEFNSELSGAILKLEKHQGYPEYASSIKRNYPGDKKLYEHIFQKFPKIKEFCEQDAVVHYFNGSIKRFKSDGEEIYQYISDSDRKNILNMIKAGFVPNALSKELAIGIDAPRLSRVAAIIKDKTEMLDPMFLLQLMGRVGRDITKEGLCCFDMFTSDESYLKIDDITTLSGEKLLKRLEESYANYIKDEKNNVEGRFALLEWDITNAIVADILNPGLLEKLFSCNIHDRVIERIKNEFNSINVQYCYDKETAIKIFIKTLERSIGELEYDCDFHKRQVSIDVKKAYLDYVRYSAKEKIDSAVGELKKSIIALQDAIKDLQSTTENPNSYWSRVAHASIMTWEQIVAGDPNSNFPIFMEQKEISQNQDASTHNVGQSVNLPSTHNQQHINSDPAAQDEPTQQTNTMEVVMYGFIIAFPPLVAVGIYSAVIYSGLVGATAFNPVIATGIFIGVAVAALVLFITVKKVCEKQSGSGLDTPPSGANLSSPNLHEEGITR